MDIKAFLQKIPIGYSEGLYKDKKYGITRTDFNAGKSLKIYAEELGGTDFISLNYYETQTGQLLKPCEMPKAKVIAFLVDVKIIDLNT
ncbi:MULTISPECIES: peptide methionine sulfoxide reductase [unclassified Leeuwenhoekiella]|uniref:peptide methionine sulfoxide reductase n=1 Tax=unclassified Leeuwenhoekiella TaxID=2615029 RepID=UPI000C56C59F|nr:MULTISPECIES: peptide methionine sulfoxide reductase [unclassified Leeuwenhoekiella]MAW95308.1 peptide methionine sulfoxide reductase [Leeuwenhoekiella sp.]MBA81768.1 peptide methionine sulfoxide reductase [Leeuwenhoekiella sp.]|tara:strand:+ start:22142 stop:22405 length:264 start_codon:yes stop_codon:yes gene_type:complete